MERAGFKKSDLKCNYEIAHPQPGGGIYGQKCDPPFGTWLADGIYIMAGAEGDQTWIIEITGGQITWVDGSPRGTLTGTYTYTDEQVMEPMAGVEVIMRGRAEGEVELTFDADLRAHMHLQESSHTYSATSNLGGTATEVGAPLQSTNMVWEPIGRCPP